MSTYIEARDINSPASSPAQIEAAIAITVSEFEACIRRNSVYQQQSLLDACLANDPKSIPIKKLIVTLVEGQLLLRRGGRPDHTYADAQARLVDMTDGADIFNWGISRPSASRPLNLRKGPTVFNRMFSESELKR